MKRRYVSAALVLVLACAGPAFAQKKRGLVWDDRPSVVFGEDVKVDLRAKVQFDWRIHWLHARETESDEDSHVMLTLTARGPIGNETEFNSSVLAGIDLGRETIVRSFRHLMSDPANTGWKLKNASDC